MASSTVAADPTAGGHHDRDSRRARAVVAALAVTQTVGYGTLYYAFAVFLVPIAADLHASTTEVTGSFTAAVLTSAILAVPIGRWLDRHGARALMTTGSLLGALLLAAWSQIDTLWQLYAVQIGIGAASAACLYEAAFAVVIAGHTPHRRPSALLAVTVVAGFASTGLQRRLPTGAVVATVFAVQGVALLALPIVGRNAVAAVVAVTGFGLGFGVATIAKPVLLADRYDTRRYATIAGTLVVPVSAAKATAPLAAAWLHTTSGYRTVFLATAVVCMLAAVALAAATSRAVPSPSRPSRPR